MQKIAQDATPACWHALLNREQIRQGFAYNSGKVHFNLETEYLDNANYVGLLTNPDFMFEDGILGHRNRLVAEITEREMISAIGLHHLHILSDHGYVLALDDVGKAMLDPFSEAGEANLRALATTNLPIAILKLERDFVKQLHTEDGLQSAFEILEAIHDLGISSPQLMLEGYYPSPDWWENVFALKTWWEDHDGQTFAISGVDGYAETGKK